MKSGQSPDEWAARARGKAYSVREQVGWVQQMLARPEARIANYRPVFDMLVQLERQLATLCGILKYGDRPPRRGR